MIKISALPAAGSLTGTELVPVVKSGVTSQTTAQAVANLGATAANLATTIHAATSKVTPVDADELPLADSAASYGLKKLLWSNLKATLKTYFDTLYAAVSSYFIYSNATKTLTAGYSCTPYNAGTKTTGTFTPDEANGNFQYYINGGAHTLAPPTNNCTLIVQITNNASAGAVTTSGFTKVTGTAPTTTNGDDFFGYITKLNGFSHLSWQALQ